MTTSDFEFDDGDLDLSALDELEQIEIGYATGTTLPPKSFGNTSNLKQRDLFGGVVVEKEKERDKGIGGSNSRGGGGGGGSSNQNASSGGITEAKVKIIKKWDLTAFSKHGWSKRISAEGRAKKNGGKGKGKKKAYGSDEEPWDDEEVIDDDEEEEEEDRVGQYAEAELLPIKWAPDPITSQTWVYPVQEDKPLRTYQYNIVHKALFSDTLVSLPTGLGKTFIAACVMLNYYRWYPGGKVIFLAPTRPLVAQQIKACHYIAGIPQGECVELTGQTDPKLRAIAWGTKRVIYCTPQTMENDLKKGRLDPRDVTCLVVDEAHRASGDYAYCGVVRFMMSRNQHFRVLALTATPGARGDAVQDVIDNLHIGLIEVRTDESMDIKQYIHTKTFDLIVVPLGTHISSIRDRWGALMKNYISPLLSARLIYTADPTMLTPYAVQLAYGKIKSLPGGGSANGKYWPMVKILSSMARGMEYLIIESLTSFHEVLKDIESEGSKTLTSKPEFRELIRDTRNFRDKQGYVGHPKMEKLRSMCIEHFVEAESELDEDGNKKETRVMIFCNFRAVVDEIVACLNQQRPLIKATSFVGQGTSKGTKGITQKDQIETIRKFKQGVFNVLVATSIGEEGLDIGEIDLIVCYEAIKSPIRMLQRVGRTGRARDGRIIVLMAEGREEKNWDKAKDAYNEVQNALISNKVFELYCDGDRMLPPRLKPINEKIQVKALPLRVETMTMDGERKLFKKNSVEENKKRKRDERLNVPNDAFLGFRTAGQLIAGSKVIPTSPGQELRDRKVAALLTAEQELQLRERWMFSGTRKVEPVTFNTQFLPFERGSTGSANLIATHSTRFELALTALRTCQELDDTQVENMDKWNEKMSNAYDPKFVRIWDSSLRSEYYQPHKRLINATPEPIPVSSFPIPTASLFPSRKISTASAIPSTFSSSPPPPSPPPQPFKKMLPPELVQPKKLPLQNSKVISKPIQSRIQSQVQVQPLPLPVATPRDEYGILSSEPDDLPLAKPTFASNSTYNLDGDEFGDLPMSDGELMRGAVVKGGKEKETFEEITIDSDGDEPLPNFKIAPITNKQQAIPVPENNSPNIISGIVIPDSDDEIEGFEENISKLPSPTPSPIIVASSPVKSVPVVLQPIPTQESEDEYGDFDDFQDVDLQAIENAALQNQVQANIQDIVMESGTEDAIMPPPLPTNNSKKANTEIVYKKRPQHHRVPDSDSSVAPESASKLPNRAELLSDHLEPSFDDSPIVAAKRGKKFIVPDSSSPVELEAGPSKLNRLRRGRQVEESDEEEVENVVKCKKKKSKRPKLTTKLAVKSKLFDIEAVNSSASGSEASSEEYSQENSDDRLFAGDYTIEEDSPGMAQIYRDSLATQAPGFQPAYRRVGVNGRGAGRVEVQGSPVTPNSYSFGSFCVDDDEELVMDGEEDDEEDDDDSQQ